ncbi:MAG: PorP/SprF family type IX secretion system membrane protein [Chitinophagaceae bacterium]
MKLLCVIDKKYSATALILLGFLCCINIKANSQDLHFSQFFNAPLIRNPSLAGIFTGDTRVQGVYRGQWNSVTDAYKTASLDAEFKRPVGKGDDFVTIGLQTMYDRAGTVGWTTIQAMPALNYHKSLSNEKNSYLSLGFMGGVVQNRIDRSKMTTNSSYDGLGDGEPNLQPQYTYIDGSVGMSYNASLNDNPDNNFFIGAAFHHFNRPKNSFYHDPKIELHPKWVYSAGVRFSVAETAYMTVLGDLSKQGSYTEVIGGLMYGLKLGEDYDNPDYVVHVGGFFRWQDAIIPTLKLDYHPFSLTFSYDVNTSPLKLSSYGRGGFEVAVSYIGFSTRSSSLDAIRCPRF